MKLTFKKIKKLSIKQKIALLSLSYFLISLGFSLIKYYHFLYNQLDLAIFYNALQQPFSNLLYSTIQGHHYFGDHLSLYLLPLKLIFNIFPSPIFLLFIQSLALTLSIIPLYLIYQNILPKKYHLFVAILFFFNPITLSINLYEFHMMVFLLPLLLTTFYYYKKNDPKKFTIFFLLTLLLREDTFLVLLAFSALAFIDKRNWFWKTFPLISVIYFFIANQIIDFFNPNQGNMFLVYYSWLGNSFLELFKNFFLHFNLVIARITPIAVLDFLGVALSSTIFLALWRPKYLLFGLLPYLALFFGPGQGFVILKTHYATPILFALIISSIYGLDYLRKKKKKFIKEYSSLLIIISLTTLLHLNYFIGPYKNIFKELTNPQRRQLAQVQQQLLNQLDKNSPTLTSYAYLSYFTSPEVYYLVYAFQGAQQFMIAPYSVPSNVQQVFIDYQDLITFNLKIPLPKYNQGAKRLQQLLQNFRLVDLTDSYAIYKKEGPKNAIPVIQKIPLANIIDNSQTFPISDNLNLINNKTLIDGNILQTQLQLQATQDIKKNYQLKIEYKDNQNNTLYSKFYPLGYGQIPSSTWKKFDLVSINYRFLIPKIANIKYVDLNLVKLHGNNVIGNLSNAELLINKEEKIGQPFRLFTF